MVPFYSTDGLIELLSHTKMILTMLWLQKYSEVHGEDLQRLLCQ